MVALLLSLSPLVVAAPTNTVVERSGFAELIDLVGEDEEQREVEEARREKDAAECASRLGEFTTPSRVSEQERDRLVRAAHTALHSTCLRPCEARVHVISSPWPAMDVFRIDYGSCYSLSSRHIAVDRSGSTFLLTGGLPTTLGEPTSTEEALRSLEMIGEIQEVWIKDSVQAEEYLRFVMRVFHGGSIGVSLPSRRVADQYATWVRHGPESRSMEDLLESEALDDEEVEREPDPPFVEIVAGSDAGWTAEAFTWKYWCGSIERFELSVTPRGRVAVQVMDYAEQPSMRDVAETEASEE